jgi:mannose-6-phosphate isomerase-like protein (cupin superfamily)
LAVAQPHASQPSPHRYNAVAHGLRRFVSARLPRLIFVLARRDLMVTIIKVPKRIEAAGTPPKRIEEFIGRVNSQTAGVSIARMVSPSGWSEPGQMPEFDEYTVVLRGTLRVETRDGTHDVSAGQAVIAPRGEWVRYSTPAPEGAEYIAVCLPAFSPQSVHRDKS